MSWGVRVWNSLVDLNVFFPLGTSWLSLIRYLPPAYEVRGKVMFHFVCSSTGSSQVSGPRSFLGGTPVPAWGRGCSRGTGVSLVGIVVPLHWTSVSPRRLNRKPSICYAAGGTPLAVRQEDCLVDQNYYFWLEVFKVGRRWSCLLDHA